jgi:hypothetical protein
MDTLAAGVRHRRDSGGPAVDQQWQGLGSCGARSGQVITTARSPVRPATRWMRVVSMASARVITGRIVVSRRASIDWPAPGGPSQRTLWSERLHQVLLYHQLQRC